MSFFEPPPERKEPRQPPQPAWLQPPGNELGVGLTYRRIAARTDAIAIVVDGLVAYSTGFSFRLSARSRPDADGHFRAGFELMRRLGGREGNVMAELLLGVEFADGRKATTLNFGEPEDGQARITQRGGGGGGGRFDTGYWVWPLPPAGDLSLVLQWDDQGVPLTRLDLDAAAIRDAAAESEPLWPEQTADGGSNWTSGQIG
jgi:hypothetical protein